MVCGQERNSVIVRPCLRICGECAESNEFPDRKRINPLHFMGIYVKINENKHMFWKIKSEVRTWTVQPGI